MRVMQEVHDMPMVGHHGEKTTRAALKTSIGPNERRHTTLHVHLCKMK
jgi:hypothetical protein